MRRRAASAGARIAAAGALILYLALGAVPKAAAAPPDDAADAIRVESTASEGSGEPGAEATPVAASTTEAESPITEPAQPVTEEVPTGPVDPTDTTAAVDGGALVPAEGEIATTDETTTEATEPTDADETLVEPDTVVMPEPTAVGEPVTTPEAPEGVDPAPQPGAVPNVDVAVEAPAGMLPPAAPEAPTPATASPLANVPETPAPRSLVDPAPEQRTVTASPNAGRAGTPVATSVAKLETTARQLLPMVLETAIAAGRHLNSIHPTLDHDSIAVTTAEPDRNLIQIASDVAIPSASLIVGGPRVPNAVAVAVEFGKAGHGWAGALVFNVWLRREMRERRMTQRQLAFISGVNHSTISRLLADGRTPTLQTATKLAHALRLEWSDEKVAAYFDLLSERSTVPTQRVEAALRGDEDLSDEDVRALMHAYLMRRGRAHAYTETGAAPNGARPRNWADERNGHDDASTEPDEPISLSGKRLGRRHLQGSTTNHRPGA